MDEAVQQTMRQALRYLERRARTEQELRQKLSDKHLPPQAIEAVLVRLKELGYVNDQKFALEFQRSRDDYKPMGKQRLKIELYQKGIAKEIIETVETDKDKEYALALRAAETRLRQYANLDKEVFYRRMSGFLARRGFDYGTIKRVIDSLNERWTGGRY